MTVDYNSLLDFNHGNDKSYQYLQYTDFFAKILFFIAVRISYTGLTLGPGTRD